MMQTGETRTGFAVQVAALALVVAVLAGGVFAFCYTTLVSETRFNFDFYPHWVGGRALWSGVSPFSDAVTTEVQVGMYGGRVAPDADQNRPIYPAYTGVILSPLLLLPPRIAVSLWMTLQLLGVLGAILLWLLIVGWKPPPLVLAGLLLGLGFIFRYPINLFLIAQFTGTMLLLLTLAAWALLRGRAGAAGAALALATVPPTIAAPVALLMLGAFALIGRWRGLVVFVAVLAALTLVSFALIGFWLPDFVRSLGEYAGYTDPIWAPSLAPTPLALLIVAATVGLVGWCGWRLHRDPSPTHQIDCLVTAPLVGLLLFPQTGNYYLVLLIPPLLVTAHRALLLAPVWRWLTWLAVAGAIFSPWVFFALEDGKPTYDTLGVPLLVGLLWGGVLLATRERPT